MIRLNFRPFVEQDFDVLVYRRRCCNSADPLPANGHRTRLPAKVGDRDWVSYDVLTSPEDSFEEFAIKASDAERLGLWYVTSHLRRVFPEANGVVWDEIGRWFEIPVEKHRQSVVETLRISVDWIRAVSSIGLTVSHRVRAPRDSDPSWVQRVRLRLDHRNRSNAEYYADVWARLDELCSRTLEAHFPLELDSGSSVSLAGWLISDSEQLSARTYRAGGARGRETAFTAVRKSGPLANVPSRPALLFLFTPEKPAGV